MERTPRRFWTFAITAGAVLVILAAAASGVFQLVVQSVPGYRADIERYVRDLTGREVRIDELGLTWRYYYPSLDLNGIALMSADGATPVRERCSRCVMAGLATSTAPFVPKTSARTS